MTQQPDNQEKLLDLINNPKTIEKAVEGSMEKRHTVIDGQDELRASLHKEYMDTAESYYFEGLSNPDDARKYAEEFTNDMIEFFEKFYYPKSEAVLKSDQQLKTAIAHPPSRWGAARRD